MNVTSSTPGRNVLSFKLSGSEKMRIASDGSVGIGTAAPATTLDVSGTTTLKGTTNLSNNNIINIGNAGIGTAAPAYKLDVIGSGSDSIVCRLQSGGANTYTTYVNTGASNLDVGTGSGGHFIYGYGSYPLYFGVNGSEKMRITSAGNVGIGTSTPASLLDVNGTTTITTSTASPLTINAGNQNSYPGLVIKGGGPGSSLASGFYLQNTGTNGNTYRFYSDENGHFNINKSTSLTGITLSNNGYVGIGISNPSYPLHVVGNTGAVTLYGALFNGNGANAVGNSTITISAKFNNSVLSEGLICLSSDKRIKKSIISLDHNTSIECLRKINTVSYKYIDSSHSDRETCGFIAQEIKEHMPNAVSTSKDYIPNLYSLVTVSKFEHNIWKVSLKQSFLEEGKFVFYANKDNSGNEYVDSEGNPFSDDNGNQRFKIKLFSFSNNQGNEIICYTYKLLTDTEFLIDGTTTTEIEERDYFLYGQYVEDKLVLNYNYIWTVCVSSVKEIDRQQQADKARIAELETEIVSLKQELDKQQTLINSILERLAI